DRDRRGAPGPRVRGVHGRGGYRAAAAQRLPAAPPRGARRPGRVGEPHAQGRDQRGAARLGHERAHDLLPPRLGARPAPVPGDGPRLPRRHRRGDAAAGPPGARPASGRAGRVRRRRLERDRALPPVHRRPPGQDHRRRARRRGARNGPARRLDDRGARGGAARLHELPAPERRRSDRHRPLDLGGARLPGRRARARLLPRRGPLRVRGRDGRGGARGLRGAHAPRGHHAGARVGPRRRARDAARQDPAAREGDRRGPLRARRQGRARRRQGPRHGGQMSDARLAQATHGARRPRGPRYKMSDARLAQATHGARRSRGPRYKLTRLGETFEGLRSRGERALVTYLTAGDPSLADTRRLVLEAARRGADVVELGVPFSDPLADGPVIQRAAMRALDRGTTLPRVLETVATLRAETNVPIALLTYYNPVLAFGLKA